MKIQFIKRKGVLIPFAEKDRELVDSFVDGAIYEVDIKNMDKRTILQNRSIHLWCEQIADVMNKENFFIQDVIKINTKWNMIKVKEILFKPVVKSLYTKDSTTKLKKNEFELVIDTLTLLLGEKGISIPDFPNKDNI